MFMWLFSPKPKLLFVDAFTDCALSAKVNGEHREKALEPWDAGELTATEELEALENDVVSKRVALVSGSLIMWYNTRTSTWFNSGIFVANIFNTAV